MFIASAPAHASLAARQIVDELRHQYILAFEASSRARDGDRWKCAHAIAALTVRARAGYPPGPPEAPATQRNRLNPGTTHSLTRTYSLGGKDEEARGRSTDSCARARRHHRLRDQEDGENAGRGSERQGRNALEVRRGERRSEPAPTKARIGEVDQKARLRGSAPMQAGRRADEARAAADAVNARADAIEKASKRLVYEVTLSEDKGGFKFGKAAMPDEAKADIDAARAAAEGRTRTAPTSRSKATPTTPAPRTSTTSSVMERAEA